MSTAKEPLLLEVNDGVALVTINLHERRNSFDLDLCNRVVTAFDDLEARDDVNAVVITGAGSAFCAGADLSHLGASSRDGLLAIYEGFLKVANCRYPTIAAVNGPAVGAGLNLALACDVRVAAESARYDARFLQLGIHPGGGNTWMLNRIVGPQTTAAMVLFNQILTGAESVAVGLSWKCVADDELISESLAMATHLSNVPQELVLRTKASIADTATITDHDTAVERELIDQAWSADQPAFRERLNAMQAKITSKASK